MKTNYTTLLQRIEQGRKDWEARNDTVRALVAPIRNAVIDLFQVTPENCICGPLPAAGEFKPGKLSPTDGELEFGIAIDFKTHPGPQPFRFVIPVKITFPSGGPLRVAVDQAPGIRVSDPANPQAGELEAIADIVIEKLMKQVDQFLT